jgi:hypothetical protein
MGIIPLLRWKMSLWNSVVILVCLRMVLASSADVPTWKCQCGENGVFARFGASITLIGAKTTVHHNCTKGRSHCYGLTVEGSPSTIQLVSPLTKEEVSVDNGGFCKFIKATGGVASGNWGGKWGADLHQTKTIGVDPPTNNCCVCC